jgi:hypothetical protein
VIELNQREAVVIDNIIHAARQVSSAGGTNSLRELFACMNNLDRSLRALSSELELRIINARNILEDL